MDDLSVDEFSGNRYIRTIYRFFFYSSYIQKFHIFADFFFHKKKNMVFLFKQTIDYENNCLIITYIRISMHRLGNLQNHFYGVGGGTKISSRGPEKHFSGGGIASQGFDSW